MIDYNSCRCNKSWMVIITAMLKTKSLQYEDYKTTTKPKH